MSPAGAMFVPFPPKTGTNTLHPRPRPQSLNWSEGKSCGPSLIEEPRVPTRRPQQPLRQPPPSDFGPPDHGPPTPPLVIVSCRRSDRAPYTARPLGHGRFGTYHAPQPTMFDYSYPDVRVSVFRHRNEECPRAVRDPIYDLSLAVFSALRPIRQTKAPLRLARDLASSQRSPFRPETIDDVLTLCDAVRQAYNTPAARSWFQMKLPQPRAAPKWQPHPQTDSSASDSSIGLNRQRQRDDPASGRGKAK